MHMHHNHHHDHGGRSHANRRRLLVTLVLTAGYMLAEIIGGVVSHSLALLADAGHMFSDVAALGLSLVAAWLTQRPRTSQRTFGYHRAEILAALVNGAALVAVSIYIFVEAFQRLRSPHEVQGPLMMAVAFGGLIINLIALKILHGGRHDNLNVRGAWLHVMSDALGSIGAIVAGVFVWTKGWYWVDPVASIVIGVLVIYSSWRLLCEAVSVLMESAPNGIDVDEVRNSITDTNGVTGVHDLHVWTITSGFEALSAHVVTRDGHSHAELLAELRGTLHDRFGIDHITIQIEPHDYEACTSQCAPEESPVAT